MNAADPFGLGGQILDGQFRVDHLVGEGGFSVVYKGHHQGLSEPIAIKCLKLPTALGTSLVDTFVQRFRDESRILYRLSQGNLNVVRSIAAGTTQAPHTGALVPYMVLEWLEGRSLENDFTVRKTIGKGGRPLDEVMTLFSGAADALRHAHEHGVVHRDLNPGNVFLVASARGVHTKVLDFGVAKILHDSALNLGPRAPTVGQIRIFAPAYGAPEQFDERIGPVGAQTDLYAFALILLEALRDRPVNEAEHIGGFAQLAVDPSRRPTPRSLGMSLPDEVDQAFARATRLDPRERFGGVAEFWSALTAAVRASTERRYRQAALATPSLPMGPVSLGANSASREPSPSMQVDPKRTVPLGSPGFAALAGDLSRATPPPQNAVPLAPGTMSPAPGDVQAQLDARRTMMLAGGPPRMGAAPAPDAKGNANANATLVDVASTLPLHEAAPERLEPSVDAASAARAAAKRNLGSTVVMDHAGTSQVHGAWPTPPPPSPATSQPYVAPHSASAPPQAYATPPPVGVRSEIVGGPSSLLGAHPGNHPPSARVPASGPPPGYVYGAGDSPAPGGDARASCVPPAPQRSSRRPLLLVAGGLIVLAIGGAVLYRMRGTSPEAETHADRASSPATSVAAPKASAPVPTVPPSPVPNTPPPEVVPASASSAPSTEPAAPAATGSGASSTTATERESADARRAASLSAAEKVSSPGDSAAPAARSTAAPSAAPADTKTKAAPSAPADPNAFDETYARSRLSSANSVLVICKRAGGLSGKGRASVTFATDGTVSAAVLAPPFAGSKEGRCAAGQFQRVKIRPFSGAPRTLEHSFEIPN